MIRVIGLSSVCECRRVFSENRLGGLQVDWPQPTKTESVQMERMRETNQVKRTFFRAWDSRKSVGLLFLREVNSATGS